MIVTDPDAAGTGWQVRGLHDGRISRQRRVRMRVRTKAPDKQARGDPSPSVAGEGHSLVPLLAARTRVELDGLVRVRAIDDPEVGRTIGLAWRTSDPQAAAFRAYAGFLRDTAPAGTRVVG